MTCKQCKHIDRCMSEASFLGQVFDPDYDGEHSCSEFDTFTNADRIRDMSDEELAEWLGEHLDCYACPVGLVCIHNNGCPGALVEWLKQPAEDSL